MKHEKFLKNKALLINLTDLKPVIHNKTFWSVNNHMIRRFLKNINNLVEV